MLFGRSGKAIHINFAGCKVSSSWYISNHQCGLHYCNLRFVSISWRAWSQNAKHYNPEHYLLFCQYSNGRQPINLSCALVHEGFKAGTASKDDFTKQGGLLLAQCWHHVGVWCWDLQQLGFVLFGRCKWFAVFVYQHCEHFEWSRIFINGFPGRMGCGNNSN